jgi:hypothetical protein
MTNKKEENKNEEELREKADRLQKQVWKMMGFTGEPTMVCIYCNIPCNWDKHNDIIFCKKCGSDWTLESMKEQCERLTGVKKK